jgi:hypothetical protein
MEPRLPPKRPKMPVRCLLGFHKRAKRKPCSKGYGPLKFCQYCRQPMEKAPDGEWRVKRVRRT